MTNENQIDENVLGALMQTAVGHLTGAAVTAGIALGDRLGLYRAMAASSGQGLTSDELAESTATHPRLVREWLDGQTAAGFLAYEAEGDQYKLSPEAALVLAIEDSPVFVAGGAELAGVNFHDLDRVESAFRTDGAFPWTDHHESLFAGTGRFFRPGYLNQLTTAWIPALDGVAQKLAAGGTVADIGCGVGHTSVIIADAYPQSTVVGVDYHEKSLELAQENAAKKGVDDRVAFLRGDVTDYEGIFDLIAFFDCLHDLGDPVAAARHARQHLSDDGVVMLVEPFALDDRAANHAQPMAAMGYHASMFLCTPNSLSQPGQRALGAQAGEARIREVFEEAGYTSFRRATETPLNIVYEAR